MEHPQDRRRGALAAAVEAGLAGSDDDNAAVMLMDLEVLHATLGALKRAPFPPGTLHTFAVKANPVGRVLELMREAGLGAEVASQGELLQALAVGFPRHRVVFDSPIKTTAELRFALEAGVRLNLDNLQELQRVADLVAADPGLLYGGQRLIGLRINPQVGEGRIKALSTGSRVSKFGVPLLERRRELLAAFAEHPWLNALHLHVGSQGVPLELTVEGIARVVELAEEIEKASGTAGGGGGGAPCRRILALDIGGGLPVQYDNDDLSWLLGPAAAAPQDPGAPPTTGAAAPEGGVASSIFERYAALLKQRLPSLFPAQGPHDVPTSPAGAAAAAAAAPPRPPPPQLVTEFGRCLVAKSVFAAGRVEYVKRCGGRRVVVSGLGGDLLLRAVYLPDTWPVRVELYGADGQPKQQQLPLAGDNDGGDDGVGVGGTGLGRGAGDGTGVAKPGNVGTPAVAAAAAGTAPEAVVNGDTDGDVDGDPDPDPAADGSWLGPTDVAGPLCFQGDRLAEAVPLPPAHPGDWVVVPDVGAYCLSMYSRYNSRCSPWVLGFRRCTAAGGSGRHGVGSGSDFTLPPEWVSCGVGVRRCGEFEFVMLRRGETVEEVMAFWNLM